jgi:hypothetical protein
MELDAPQAISQVKKCKHCGKLGHVKANCFALGEPKYAATDPSQKKYETQDTARDF